MREVQESEDEPDLGCSALPSQEPSLSALAIEISYGNWSALNNHLEGVFLLFIIG